MLSRKTVVFAISGMALPLFAAGSASAASTSCWVPRSILKQSSAAVVSISVGRNGGCSFAVSQRSVGRPAGIRFRVNYPSAVVAQNEFRPRAVAQPRCFIFNNDRYCE